MADDIDIEEHDVLDNPRIKNIFPDIINIKTEVIEYEEEDNIDYDNENYDTCDYDSLPEDDDRDNENMYQNKIILGTKPCASESSDDDEISVPKLVETFVELEDWGALLLNNPCYCQSCQILFPTINALDSHKMTTHSFLIAVGNNKAIKSTSKSSISARLKFEPESNIVDLKKNNLCNHCNQIFPDEIALLKHSYELLPRKFVCDYCDLVFDSEAACKVHKMTHSYAECLRCPICSCYFKYGNKLISHLSLQHHTEMIDLPKRVEADYKCAFCDAKMKDNKTYNGHILYHHSQFYNKIVGDKVETDKFKCIPCNLTFPSAYSERIHRAAQHTKSNRTTNRQPLELEEQIKTEPILSPKKCSPQKIDFNRRPIPKSVLFKCNKCQLHFVSCLVAIEHTKRCVLKKGDWKCKKCRRSFKWVDRQTHITQHEFTERFKVITVQEETLNKIVCRCKSCKICFDERSLLKYHTNGCTESNYVFCNLCNFRVHEHAITKHKRVHTELGTDQFVIVDFVSGDQLSSVKNTKTDLNIKTINNIEKTTESYKKEKFYYYCPTCQCFMKVNKLPDKHNVGRCRKHLLTCLCKLCGLRFSKKGFLSHKKEHKRFPNLKIRDLTFRNTQSGRKINPPFPDFKKCKSCDVMFFSCVALKSHVCNIEEAKTCGYCGEKFSDLAYKLHVPFHEYSGNENKIFTENIPELIKKYESFKIVWNILYLCETCDTIFHDYDEVVEHSQNHFCNMESYNVTINHCVICDLKIVGKCYEKHKKLHLANSITKDSFKILPFNYETLLTDDWSNMFKVLAKEQVDQILNKSKYKHTRSVRMQLLVDGPIDLTLYQCAVCKIIVELKSLRVHSQNRYSCVNSIKLTCSICQLNFSSKNSLYSHRCLHERHTITNKTFRILSFNDEKDLYVNDSLRSKMNPESLKFIRCQHCGKLINKSKYKRHIEYHNYITKKKDQASKVTGKNQPKYLVRSKFKKIKTTIAHNFYKCKKCGVCVFKNYVQKHFCSSKKQKRQCSKCHLWFRSSNMNKHLMYHEKYKLTKNNINVIIFKNGKIEKSGRKEDQVILYQCSDCLVCLHREMNIKRHICISSNYQKTCRICNMPFHCSRMQVHEKFHEDKSFTQKNVLIKKFKSKVLLNENPKNSTSIESKQNQNTRQPKLSLKDSKTKTNNDKLKPIKNYISKPELSNPEFLRHVHIRYFKCTSCKLLFITPSSLLEHTNFCPNDNNGVKCDTCGLIFHEKMIHLHQKIKKCSPQKSIIYIVTLEGGKGSEYDENSCLYHCKKCEMYYLSFRAIFKHFEDNHTVIMRSSKCDLCDILLSCRSYSRHKLLHHDNRDLSLSEVIKFDVLNVNLSKALKDLPNNKLVNIIDYVPELNESIDQDKQKAVKRKNVVEEDVVKKQIKLDKVLEKKKSHINDFINDLYTCNICNLNFLHKRTLEVHVNKDRHDDRKFRCSECRLIFTQNSLTRHLKFHHGTHIENINNYKILISEVNEEVIAVNEDKVKDTQQLQQQSETITKTIDNKTTNKLYKCSECNVYYLCSDVCKEHMSNHVTLDPTEYIACKICDLQFPCEYLGNHMKCHREKILNLDDLIVEEYQLNDGNIKIEVYSAADRLKSKLVTTTTHFDTEDEKNEKDDCTIDSTFSVTGFKSNFVDGISLNEDNSAVGGESEANEIEMTSYCRGRIS